MGKSKSKATSGNGTSDSGKLEEGLKQLEAAASFLSNPDLLPKMEKYISEQLGVQPHEHKRLRRDFRKPHTR